MQYFLNSPLITHKKLMLKISSWTGTFQVIYMIDDRFCNFPSILLTTCQIDAKIQVFHINDLKILYKAHCITKIIKLPIYPLTA